MSKYKGAKCQYCQEIFEENSDVVICPECGSPYHRICYKQSGECVRKDLHENNASWHNEAETTQSKQGEVFVQCKSCGAYNSSENSVCHVCKAPIDNKNADSIPNAEPNNQQPPYDIPGFGPFVSMRFEKVNMDEEIDGVTVRDMSAYLGQNSGYFIPRFLKMKKEKKLVSWNWSAFIFDYLYLFYRKTISIAVLFGLLLFITNIPSLFYQLYTLAQGGYIQSLPFLTESFANKCLEMSSYLSYIALGLQLLFGMFFNRFYMEHVIKRIKKLKKQASGSEEFYVAASKKGGVLGSRVILVALMILFGFSFFTTVITTLF